MLTMQPAPKTTDSGSCNCLIITAVIIGVVALAGGLISWIVFMNIFLANADDLKDDGAPCRAHEVWVWCLVSICIVAADMVFGKSTAKNESPMAMVVSILGALILNLGIAVYGTVLWAAVENDTYGATSCRDYFDADSDHANLLTIFIVTVCFKWVVSLLLILAIIFTIVSNI